MVEVATAAEVSNNTMSLASLGSSRISEATRGRIEAVATMMGYRLNPTVGT